MRFQIQAATTKASNRHMVATGDNLAEMSVLAESYHIKNSVVETRVILNHSGKVAEEAGAKLLWTRN